MAVARADTAVAFAQLLSARAWQNPALSASYSKSTPRYHVALELPLDFPALRRARIGAAQAGGTAARYRFAAERAAVALDADTTYTRALAARERARLSRRNAEDADSLRRLAVVRRAAGDVSDLDVALATVTAGEAANTAAADSLAYLSALLDLQAVMGIGANDVFITLADSLTMPPPISDALMREATDSSMTNIPLLVAAARSTLASAQLSARVQHRSVFSAPSVSMGFETGDPSGAEPGILPTVGIALPFPLLNRNQGAIAQAEAEQGRARAELTLAEVQSRTEITRARRTWTAAVAKVQRDQTLVVAANQVAAMAVTAYREGASSLSNAIEARRSARDVLLQYLDDLADAWTASAQLRFLTLTPTSTIP